MLQNKQKKNQPIRPQPQTQRAWTVQCRIQNHNIKQKDQTKQLNKLKFKQKKVKVMRMNKVNFQSTRETTGQNT